jgi:hypothetical protein
MRTRRTALVLPWHSPKHGEARERNEGVPGVTTHRQKHAVVAFRGSARQAAEAVDFACYVQLIPALPSAIASTSHTDAPASHCHGPNASGSIR